MSSASQRSWGHFEAAGAASTLRSDALASGPATFSGLKRVDRLNIHRSQWPLIRATSGNRKHGS
jgi:hypothetical protein